jgi:hypothetical protein
MLETLGPAGLARERRDIPDALDAAERPRA